MADLSRQLQEYLAQSKSSSGSGLPPAPPSPSRAAAEEAEPLLSGSGWGSGWWFGSPSSEEEEPPPSSPPSPEPSSSSSSSWRLLLLPAAGGLSRGQRLWGAGLCLSLGAFCFGLAALAGSLLRLRKFALLWSLGSAFALGAAAFLRGGGLGGLGGGPGGRPLALLFYLGSVAATLYAALALRSGLLATLGAAVQVAAGAAYLLASVPGGATGLRYAGRLLGGLVRRRVSKTLPV